ncbi:hypothetical protein ABMA27_012237 [Loxostege sticticalis]|uniref:C2H2-type domain-containing protein n=1 Tax=Loxostege sticticalis TaxID=481309 RepID=A0ABR3H0M1_LOXSC
MKEIDINIEGYNVNGICVGCLNYNRKMFYVDAVKECFKLLAEIDVPDGLSIQVCWECLAAVRKAMQFRDQILKAYEILIDYSAKNPFLNSPSDFTRHSTTHLSTSVTTNLVFNADTSEVEVKDEPVAGGEEEYEVEIKDEDLKFEEELPELDVHFDGFAEEQNVSSDEDVQLSKLREKKEKKEKKLKKTRKKRKKDTDKEPEPKKYKSLPPDVEMYTMTEEEMWLMREADRTSEQFRAQRSRCEDCLLTFHSEQLLRAHTLARHQEKGENSHQCDVCKVYFLTKDHLTTHRLQHLTAYRCAVCGARTSVRKRARQHASTHNKDQEKFECGTCEKTFPTRSKLQYHRSKHHKEKLQCDCCGKVFASKMTLKYHLKSQSQSKEDKPKEEKLYIPCKGCNKVFHSKKSYRAHVVIHNGLTYPCPICGKLFQWKRNLARHTRNHRERDAGATHECRACGKTFASRDCLNNHMRLSKRHVPEDAYSHACNYCGKKFATKYCMVDHIDWDHLKRIKYQCSVCFKAFKTAKIMVAHMNNIHGGKKSKEPDGQHLCEVCGKSYKSVKRLKGHVWAMHTNRSSAKIFKCKLCPATFAWQTSIYKHTKMMHEQAKRAKQTRTVQPVKKQEPYPEIELANRMQYFQQNIVPNITHTVQPLPVGIVQNIV